MSSAIELFYCYAHEDEEFRVELEKHLSLLKRQGLVRQWHDRKITAGTEWKGEIDSHLESSQIVLLLISSDFVASDYCYDIELKRAMERHEAKTARVVPVILRPVDWNGTSFSRLQALPKDAKPVTKWRSRDEAFADVAAGLRKVIAELNPNHVMTPVPDSRGPADYGETSDSNVGEMVATAQRDIELVLNRDFESFTEDDQRRLFRAMKELCGIVGKITLVEKRRGSLILRLGLSDEDAQRLIAAVGDGKLRCLGVTSVRDSGIIPDKSVESWIEHLKTGDETAAQRLWERYFVRLVALARSRLSDRVRPAFDEEDIVLDVFVEFFRRIQHGQFPQLHDRNDLWRLLVLMTTRRAIDMQRREMRHKRGSGSVDIDTMSESDLNLVVGDTPTPEFVAIVAEEMERLLSNLNDETLRATAIAKLEGRTNREIADHLNVSLRSVERRLSLIRSRWRGAIE